MCSLYLFHLFKIILSETLLPYDRAQAIPAENGNTSKPKPVTDKITDVVIAPIMTTVSIGLNY